MTRWKTQVATSLAALSLLAMDGPGHAQDDWLKTPLASTDLTQGTLPLDPSWASGVLRVLVSGPGDPATWVITLHYGEQRLELDGPALASRQVRKTPAGIIIDIPVPDGGPLWATTNTSGLRVRTMHALAISPFKPQQRLDGSIIRSIDATSSALEKTYAGALARLDPMDANGNVLSVCTAFRVAKGYWLTAAHCVYRDKDGAPVIARWRLQTMHLAGVPEDPRYWSAAPIASGLQAANISGSSLLGPRDLDYALLRVDDDPGGAQLPIGREATPQAGTKLELLQHWNGLTPKPGKAVADGEACKIRNRLGDDDYSESINCPYGIQHGCSSEGGGSGGALIRPTGGPQATAFQLVGLHYGKGQDNKFNCAVPVLAIARDLCRYKSKLPGGMLSCP